MSQQTQDVDGAARRAHHDYIGQPHTRDEGPIAGAEASADGLSTREAPLGPLTRRWTGDRRSCGARPRRPVGC